jgi:hypothetical protein
MIRAETRNRQIREGRERAEPRIKETLRCVINRFVANHED